MTKTFRSRNIRVRLNCESRGPVSETRTLTNDTPENSFVMISHDDRRRRRILRWGVWMDHRNKYPRSYKKIGCTSFALPACEDTSRSWQNEPQNGSSPITGCTDSLIWTIRNVFLLYINCSM